MTINGTHINFPDGREPLAQLINGEISLEEFRVWLNTPDKNHLFTKWNGNEANLISAEEQARRRDAVRQANASVMLEGFAISAEVVWLNELYIRGEISIEEKGVILHKLYRAE